MTNFCPVTLRVCLFLFVMAPVAGHASSESEQFVVDCAKETSLGSAKTCTCVQTKLDEIYSGAERSFIRSLFTDTLSDVAQSDIGLTEKRQEALMDESMGVVEACEAF